ncbi:hypothetical protein MTsPCn5_05630 [Croceitalea sp. MTPC5]|uniref:Crp/Fnr family transcriptional regulator n=1 Tax=Croceitalea sp. MTPC5 TaxID=3056565 RepID=UPI002B3A9F1E|nr:hypothetical protein MTsPCn5_05630 [Croceitalea sp. MTPC5]
MLRAYFNGFGALSEANMDFLLGHIHEGSLSKKQKLIQANQTVGSIYFVTEGFLHYYTHNDFGNQVTLKIIAPNFCWTIMDSFFHQRPTLDECQALSDVRFHELKKSDFLKIKAKNVILSNFIQNITEQILSAKALEVRKQLSMSAEERYLDILNTNPKIVREVPVSILASLIGTSRETLHRIRRRLSAA